VTVPTFEHIIDKPDMVSYLRKVTEEDIAGLLGELLSFQSDGAFRGFLFLKLRGGDYLVDRQKLLARALDPTKLEPGSIRPNYLSGIALIRALGSYKRYCEVLAAALKRYFHLPVLNTHLGRIRFSTEFEPRPEHWMPPYWDRKRCRDSDAYATTGHTLSWRAVLREHLAEIPREENTLGRYPGEGFAFLASQDRVQLDELYVPDIGLPMLRSSGREVADNLPPPGGNWRELWKIRTDGEPGVLTAICDAPIPRELFSVINRLIRRE